MPRDLLAILNEEQWSYLHCPMPWAIPVSNVGLIPSNNVTATNTAEIQIYTVEELLMDSIARIRLHMGVAAFACEAQEKLRRVAGAYTAMRLSTNVSWKLFGELFINTMPTSAKGLDLTI